MYWQQKVGSLSLLTVVPDSDMLPSLSVDGTQLYDYCLSLLERGGLWIVNAYWIEFSCANTLLDMLVVEKKLPWL